MIDLSVVTEIDAPAETVWKALTDLERFHEWNPFIKKASGTPAVGATVVLRVQSSLPLPLPLVFRPRILVCDKDRELRWRGHFVHAWLASGDHWFTLEPLGKERTRLIQHEIFTGLLPPLAARLLAREARLGFLAMNQALKERVERARPPQAAVSRAAM